MIATPDPVMSLITSAGLKGGYSAALKTIFETNFTSLILIGCSILSLKGILQINQNALNLIKLFGCAYIAYLGLSILKEVLSTTEHSSKMIHPSHGGF